MSIHAPNSKPGVFHLICEVFKLVIATKCQFFNQLHCLVQDQNLEPHDGDGVNLTINTLSYIKKLLEEHKKR